MTNKYQFNLDTLQPGDILLSRGEGKGAAFIAKATGGRFSHAMVYVGNSVIHAMPDGVYSKNPQRLLFHSNDDLLALRARGGLTDEQASIIVDTARYWVGALYSKAQAAAVPAYSKARVPTTSPEQFCSRLVAQCYMAAKIQLVVNPDYCSPNDIARSGLLDPVANYSVLASQQAIEFAEDTVDPNMEIQRAAFTWLAKARKLASRRGLGEIATQSEVGHLIYKNPELDSVICNYIHASGYLKHFDVDRSINAFRYDVTLFLEKFSSNHEIMDAIEVESKINLCELYRHRRNYDAARENARQLPNKYNQLQLRHASNLLIEVHDRLDVLKEVVRTLA